MSMEMTRGTVSFAHLDEVLEPSGEISHSEISRSKSRKNDGRNQNGSLQPYIELQRNCRCNQIHPSTPPSPRNLHLSSTKMTLLQFQEFSRTHLGRLYGDSVKTIPGYDMSRRRR
eukprot:UN12590